MDAHRTAETRIDQVERRLIALQEAGLDTAGLVSRLEVARSALSQGRPHDVPAICEDILADARRLAEGGATPAVPRPSRPVRTERRLAPEPSPAAPSETMPLRDQVQALLTPSLMALEGRLEARLDERLAGIGPLVESLKAQIAERPGLDPAAMEQAIEAAVTPLIDRIQAQVADQFRHLSAAPPAETGGVDEATVASLVASAVGGLKAEMESRLASLPASTSVDEERLVAALGSRLDARLEAVTDHTAMALEALRSEMRERPLPAPATVRVQQAVAKTLPEATAQAVDDAVAPLEQRLEQRLTAMASTLGALEAQVRDLRGITGPDLEERFDALHGQVTERLESLVGERLPEILGDSLRSLDATVAATVRDLVGQALAQVPAPAAAPPATTEPTVSADDLRTQVAEELRADLDFQIEQLAAQKGWVSINDVRAELAQRGGVSAGPSAGGGATFARLEAALVEFVRQTQTQQEQFLAVLHDKVERHTEILVDRAMTGSISRSATTPAPSPSSEAINAPGLDPLGSSEALDPLPRDGHDQGIPEIAHSTQVLNALARGGLAGIAASAPAADFANGMDPDLPPSEPLDPLTSSGQQAALGDASGAVADVQPDSGILEALAAVDATARSADEEEPSITTAGLPDDERPAESTALPSDLTAEEPSTRMLEALAQGSVPASDDVLPQDIAPAGLDGTNEPAAQEPATATVAAPSPNEDDLDSNVRELDPVVVPEGAVLGLDFQETATFHAVETRTHASPSDLGPVTVDSDEVAAPTDTQTAAAVAEGEAPVAEGLAVPDHDPAAVPEAELSAMPEAATADVADAEPSAMTDVEPSATPEVPLATATTSTTSRRSIGDIEAALRRLIDQEVERHLGRGLPALTNAVQAAVDEAMAAHRAAEADHLEANIRTVVGEELSRRAPDPAKDLATLAEVLRQQAARGPAPGDLREAMVALLQDPQVRQTVLEIVAVEAIANPGPLAELTGLRAFIRREVRQAASAAPDDLPQDALIGGP